MTPFERRDMPWLIGVGDSPAHYHDASCANSHGQGSDRALRATARDRAGRKVTNNFALAA